jgi:hypothetical protein
LFALFSPQDDDITFGLRARVLLLLGLVFLPSRWKCGSKLNGKGSRRAGAGCCFPDQKLIETKARTDEGMQQHCRNLSQSEGVENAQERGRDKGIWSKNKLKINHVSRLAAL